MARLTDPLWSFPATLCLSLLLRAVKLRAMFFLTPLILESLAELPDDALAFLRVRSSSLSFSMLPLIV